jgi:hypothetical protein
MADRPWATAPDLSMAALSHSRTLWPSFNHFFYLKSSAASSHSTAHEEKINFTLLNFRISDSF